MIEAATPDKAVVLHWCKGIGRGHRVSPAGLPIEQVLGEYTHFLSFRRDVA